MVHKIGIYYNQKNDGIKGIISSAQMEALEQQIMMQKKNQIEAAFLQKFGVPGKFKTTVVYTPNKRWHGNYHGGRVIFRVVPDDARTYALLRREPGWINQFIQ